MGSRLQYNPVNRGKQEQIMQDRVPAFRPPGFLLSQGRH